MRPCRLHVTGASGSGTTTLGRALASAWSVPHADADDYFWMPTVPPYTHQRPVADRVPLMDEVFARRDAWVLSGSSMGWAKPLERRFDAVVFLTIDTEARMARLREREATRYGDAILPGGSRADAYAEFMEWANRYDDPTFDHRSRARHESWLAGLACSVLRLDSAAAVEDLVAATMHWEPGAPQR